MNCKAAEISDSTLYAQMCEDRCIGDDLFDRVIYDKNADADVDDNVVKSSHAVLGRFRGSAG